MLAMPRPGSTQLLCGGQPELAPLMLLAAVGPLMPGMPPSLPLPCSSMSYAMADA